MSAWMSNGGPDEPDDSEGIATRDLVIELLGGVLLVVAACAFAVSLFG
jgi:hypothetical protein